RYTFPRGDASNILLDLTHRDRVLDSGLKITGDRTIVGWRRSSAWAKDQIVYFAAEFSRPFKSFGIAVDDRLAEGIRESSGKNIKAFFRFDTNDGSPVLTKLAISSTGIEGAQKNLAAE